MTVSQKFAARLRIIRERAGLLKSDVAKKTGLDPTFLGRVERGEREPSWETACKLADALGVKTEDFR
jgi:transcriptional regulator with XRE-family HTH domain